VTVVSTNSLSIPDIAFLPKLEQKTVVGDDRHGNVTGKLILAVEIFDSDQNGTGIIGKQIQAHKWLGRSLTSGVQQRDWHLCDWGHITRS
jgi:hypothetical protein